MGFICLFGEVSGPWVAAHFDLEQWAQNEREKKYVTESQRKKRIPEIVEAMMARQDVVVGEDLNTGMETTTVEPDC